MKFQNRHLFLPFIIAFIVLAVIEIFSKNSLNPILFNILAFSSVIFSIADISYYLSYKIEQVATDLTKRFDMLPPTALNQEYDNIRLRTSKLQRQAKVFKCISNAIYLLTYVGVFVLIIVHPYMHYRGTMPLDKLTNVLTLGGFAALLLNLYIRDCIDKQYLKMIQSEK